MSGDVLLGEIDLPEGVLVVLDPGLARYWRHDGDPASPRNSDPPEYDLAIVGADAEAGGRAYDREFDPLHLFDRRDPDDAKQHFDAFAVSRGFQATASTLAERVPHTERVGFSLSAGDGIGVVNYNGLWAVVASGLPTDRPLPVVGTPLADGEFAGRWQHIDIVVDADADIASDHEIHGVMVDHGQLMFAGLSLLGQFRMWESLDGLADYVFWGRDAAALAKELGAQSLGGDHFGWVDVPVGDIGDKARAVQHRISETEIMVGADYRPHCNLEKLNAGMRESTEDTAELVLDGSRIVGCGNRWGDGVFSVSRLADAGGRIARIRVNLGTEQRQKTMRQVLIRSRGAIVTRAVLDDGQPIRFAERMEPNNPSDSGWFLCAGTEDEAFMDNAENFVIVRVSTVVEKCPEFAEILDAPEGCKFRRDGERFVVDD